MSSGGYPYPIPPDDWHLAKFWRTAEEALEYIQLFNDFYVHKAKLDTNFSQEI